MRNSIVVCGAFGRMGQRVIDLALATKVEILGATINSLKFDKPKAWPFPIYQNLELILNQEKVGKNRPIIIDFSCAKALREHLRLALNFGCGILVATTGHDQENLMAITDAAQKIPVIFAPNTSLMANIMLALTKLTASLATDFDAEILEIHHKEKRDAPSGTALMLKDAIGAEKAIKIQSLRKDDVAGEHTVYFFNDFERLELCHRVFDRKVFAQGALLAAQFLFDKASGLYNMSDVLNLTVSIKNND